MKLFKKYDINLSAYGDVYKLGIIFAFGKIHRNMDVEEIKRSEDGRDVSAFHRMPVQEGTFIRIELPFKKTVTYTCPEDCIDKTSPCRPTWLFTWRNKDVVKPGYKKMFAWNPFI